jgi:hypothetical protein
VLLDAQGFQASPTQILSAQEAIDRDTMLDIIKRHRLEKQWTDFQTRGL